VLLAEACLRGEVGLEEPISELLPENRLPHWSRRAPTLEELATHRGALPNAPSGLGRAELAFALGLRSTSPWAGLDEAAYQRAVRATRSRRAPGGRMLRYSSLGFALIGAALEACARSPYEELLRERLTGSLDMTGTAIRVPAHARGRLLAGRSRRGRPRPPLEDWMAPSGAIRSSASDMLTFLAASMRPPERAPGPRWLSPWAGGHAPGDGSESGSGGFILERRYGPPLIWHNGGTWGFRAFAAMVPESSRVSWCSRRSSVSRSVPQAALRARTSSVSCAVSRPSTAQSDSWER
jgi:CubicO group peptidase (beta-lactamase class C family)